YLEMSGRPGVSAYPFSVAIRCRPDALDDMCTFSMGSDSVLIDHSIIFRDPGNNDIYMRTTNGGDLALTTLNIITYVTDEWIDLVGVWVSSDERHLYSGGLKTSNVADSADFGVPTQTGVGRRIRSDQTNIAFSGKIEYVFVWNRALTIDPIEWISREPYAMFQQNRVRLFSVAGGIAVFASISDGFGISDTIITKTGYIRSAADNVGVTDVLTRIATYIRSLASNLATTDTINTVAGLKRSMSDNVGVTDTLTPTKGVSRSIADTIGITDIIATILGRLTSIADTIGITDAITFIITTTIGSGRVFIAGIAKLLRISGKDKSLKISGSGD
ncbi:hypothetical protein LCGC14_2886890, partial [marine sediment metagenome]